MRRFALLLALLLAAAVSLRAQSAEADSLRAAYMAAEMALDAPGTPAADFAMCLPDGSDTRLGEFRGAPLLLVLFDADCPDCRHALEALPELVPQGMRVLAVYAEGDPSLWAAAEAEVPDGFIVAFDIDGVYPSGLYSPEFSPGIYVLDAEGIVQERGSEILNINLLHKY